MTFDIWQISWFTYFCREIVAIYTLFPQILFVMEVDSAIFLLLEFMILLNWKYCQYWILELHHPSIQRLSLNISQFIKLFRFYANLGVWLQFASASRIFFLIFGRKLKIYFFHSLVGNFLQFELMHFSDSSYATCIMQADIS